jgi:hypothetical protein
LGGFVITGRCELNGHLFRGYIVPCGTFGCLVRA